MIQPHKHQFFSKIIFIILIVGQVLGGMSSYEYWELDSDNEFIELCSSEDNEQEVEEDKKEYNNKFYTQKYETLISSVSVLYSEVFLSFYHSKPNTPPPESFTLLL